MQKLLHSIFNMTENMCFTFPVLCWIDLFKLNQFKSAKIKGNDFGEEEPNKELLEDEIILKILKRGVKTNDEDYNLSYEGDDVVQQEQSGKEETSLEEDSEQKEEERATSDESYQSWGLAAFDQLGNLQRGDDYEETRS